MATQINTINDLSTLTRIPSKILDTIIDKEMLCIGSAIHDAIVAKETSTSVNIGLGTLSIDLVDMQCKFLPSKDLKAIIKKCLVDKVDPVELALEETLIQKLEALYEEVK